MIFGAKTLYSANTNIDALFENGDLGDRTGAISLVQKEGRKTINSGKIYFRKNFVYAVEIDNHPIPIGKRVATGGLVDYNELNEVCQTAGSPNSQKVVDLLLERQLISEKQLNIYIKEHFLGLMEEILSWDNCEGTWIPEVSTKNFVMPYVPIHKIRSIIDNRKKYRNGFTKSVQSFFDKKEVPNLTFVATNKNPQELNSEFGAVFGFATGEYTVAQIAEQTGLDVFNALQAVVWLWQEDFLNVQLGGIKIPYASLIKKVNTEEEKPQEEYKEEIIPLDSPAPVVEEAEEAEENHDEEIILRAETAESIDYTLPNSTTDMVTENEPVADEPVSSEDRADDENHYEEEYLESPVTDAQPAVSDDDDYLLVEDEIVEDEVAEEPETLETPEMEDVLFMEPAVEGTEEFETEPAREVLMAEKSAEAAEELTEPEAKEIMPTPNKTLRAGKIQELALRLTELQSHVAELEENSVSVEAAWEEAETRVSHLEEELLKARERAETMKEARDNIASDYETACNEVSELLTSFQIGG